MPAQPATDIASPARTAAPTSAVPAAIVPARADLGRATPARAGRHGAIPASAASGGETAALEALAAELTARGWIARLRTGGWRTSLFVRNPDPEASVLSEHIYAGPDASGVCHFWWSWAERVARAADVPAAAEVITRVLRATGPTTS